MFQYLSDEEAQMYANLLSKHYPDMFKKEELEKKFKERVTT